MTQASNAQVSPTGELHARLAQYYTRYYRDVLGLPDWSERVDRRLGSEDEFEGRQLASIERVLGSLAGRRILNVGCGTGGFNVAAECAGARSYGIDVSPDVVTICGLRRACGHGGLYSAAAAEALPFRDGEFDTVFCLSALEHVADVETSLREMMRVLRVGGTLLLWAPNGWACYESHYKVASFPLFLRPLTRLRLRWGRRPTAFVDTLNALTERRCRTLLGQAGAVIEPSVDDIEHGVGGGGSRSRIVRVYYRVFGIKPYIALIARKSTP